MKRISKRVGRVLGLVLAFAMMMSIGSVYAGDVEKSNVIFDESSYVMTSEEKVFFEELISIAKSRRQLRANVSLTVPYYQQTDSQWRYDIMQSAGLDIGNYGCALTSFAMIMGYYRWSDNPRVVNQKLGVYACPIMWNDAGRIYGRSARVSTGYSHNDFMSIIKGAIFSYQPAIIGMSKGSGSHFVVAHTYVDEYGWSPIVNINDPGYYREYSLSSYLDAGWSISSVVVYT